jgi:hypothetical protein
MFGIGSVVCVKQLQQHHGNSTPVPVLLLIRAAARHMNGRQHWQASVDVADYCNTSQVHHGTAGVVSASECAAWLCQRIMCPRVRQWFSSSCCLTNHYCRPWCCIDCKSLLCCVAANACCCTVGAVEPEASGLCPQQYCIWPSHDGSCAGLCQGQSNAASCGCLGFDPVIGLAI